MRLSDLQTLKEDGLVVPGVNTTIDVKPGETKRQAAKLGNEVDENGIPPIMNSNGTFNKPLDSKPTRS